MFEHSCAKCEKTFVSRSKLNHHNNQLPSQWSDGTKKEYARKLKKSFKQRVKDLELEEEIKDLFKRDQGREKPSPVTERAVIGMISDFEVSDRKMIKILRRMRELFGRNAVTPYIHYSLQV